MGGYWWTSSAGGAILIVFSCVVLMVWTTAPLRPLSSSLLSHELIDKDSPLSACIAANAAPASGL